MLLFRNHKTDLAVIFGVSALIYIIQSLGWPLNAGRDFNSYVNYFDGMWRSDPVFQYLMLYRTPVTPLFIGILYKAGGEILIEIVLGLMYSLSILTVYYIGLAWSRKVGLISAMVLVIYPGYGALYHEIASDVLSAFGFILWAAFVCNTAKNPTRTKFIINGILVFILVMIRPISQLLIIFALFPFFLPGLKIRQKVLNSIAFLVVVISLLLGWSAYNYYRYNDFAVTRGNKAIMPFWRLYCADRLVKPENGPASKALADMVQKDLLDKEPYKSYGVNLDQVFSTPVKYKNTRIWSDIVSLVDRTWGWESDYEILQWVAIEAIKAYPFFYLKNVALEIAETMNVKYMPNTPRYPENNQERTLPILDAKGMPVPTERQIIPYSYMPLAASNDKNVIISGQEALEIYQKTREEINMNIKLPYRKGYSDIATILNLVTGAFPGMDLCLIIGIILLAFNMRGQKVTLRRSYLFLTGLGLIIVIASCFSQTTVVQYRLPYDPIFVLIAITALVGERERADKSALQSGNIEN